MAGDRPVALVTGGNKGIGRAIVTGLAHAGFTVLLGARNAERGQAAAAELSAEGNVRFVQLDVTAQRDVDAAAARIATEFGELDVLVNNAGIHAPDRDETGFPSPSAESAEVVALVYETNVFAVIRMTNALLPLLRRAPAGRIVNVTSKRGSLGEPGAWEGQPQMSYSSSKTALNAITAHYARELAPTPIKINGAAPGHVATAFNNYRGKLTPEQGAEVVLWLATLGPDGPNGQVFENRTALAW
jgi:NAD(P)-dependent dehydrogenase (short-subunit alcohol dehydrogenase family)